MTNPKFPPDVIAAIVDEGKKQGIPIVVARDRRREPAPARRPGRHRLPSQPDRSAGHAGARGVCEGEEADVRADAREHGVALVLLRASGDSEHADAAGRAVSARQADARRRRAKGADAVRAGPARSGRRGCASRRIPFIKAMSDAGVRVVTGTDCGAEASQITPFGHATHREIQMFVEAGMPPLAAIRAATLDAARVITRSEDPDYGSIRAGKAADLRAAATPTRPWISTTRSRSPGDARRTLARVTFFRELTDGGLSPSRASALQIRRAERAHVPREIVLQQLEHRLHAVGAVGRKPHMTGRASSTPCAPNASAFAMSLPRRKPPSTSTAAFPATASTIAGSTSIGAVLSAAPP